jgi:hypothetical protein
MTSDLPRKRGIKRLPDACQTTPGMLPLPLSADHSVCPRISICHEYLLRAPSVAEDPIAHVAAAQAAQCRSAAGSLDRRAQSQRARCGGTSQSPGTMLADEQAVHKASTHWGLRAQKGGRGEEKGRAQNLLPHAHARLRNSREGLDDFKRGRPGGHVDAAPTDGARCLPLALRGLELATVTITALAFAAAALCKPAQALPARVRPILSRGGRRRGGGPLHPLSPHTQNLPRSGRTKVPRTTTQSRGVRIPPRGATVMLARSSIGAAAAVRTVRPEPLRVRCGWHISAAECGCAGGRGGAGRAKRLPSASTPPPPFAHGGGYESISGRSASRGVAAPVRAGDVARHLRIDCRWGPEGGALPRICFACLSASGSRSYHRVLRCYQQDATA